MQEEIELRQGEEAGGGETKRPHYRCTTLGWTLVITRDGNLTGPGETDEGNQKSGNMNKGGEQKAQQEQNNSRKFQTIEGVKHHLYEST